ncbi:SDR family oxidoreductase [Galbitalea soli]|uniref:NAD-dependent epimerase/dehydratase family protein n=1 Tax=Galbitalea soli TaxID=1268042 RepID=A0A7C9TQF6_9MICO|nr:NAD-dependent epimerase/dehydratase family protein [Galbitalea soli]NYJ30110.1 HAD superfamily hydrolase (TIGR01490 family) [Galbitalea soli]
MSPRRAATDLGSAHVFLTGGTGFVGQAILERLLSSHPGTTISLLIRTKGSTSGEDRLRTLLRKPVFTAWRERVGEEEVERAVRDRLRVIEGGLSNVPALPGDLDVVIHSASTVSFDPPIDQAFDTNVGGAIGLYEALAASGGDPRVVHVSTAYVGGIRKGIQPEASLTHEVDWRAEYEAAKGARVRVEMASREPQTLRKFIGEAKAGHGKEGPQAVAKAAEAARVAWVQARLVDYGRMRAESLGWTDVYTLTKAFAERAAETMWAQAGHRLSIVRPAIIESALRHPFPGWIDGFKVADPLILAYGRGMLPEFPGLPDSVLDLIPVDFVVNVILAVAANPAPAGEPEYFHVSSGAGNPLPFHRMFQNVNTFFLANPMPQGDSGHIAVPMWKFPGGRRVERSLLAKERANELLGAALERLPSSARTRERLAKVDSNRRDLESLRNFTQLYRAYVQTEIIFDDTRTKALNAALPAKARADIGFDVTEIDWEDYLQRVHFPSITAMTRAFQKRPAASERAEKALPTRSDVVAIFDLEGTVVDSNIVQQYLWVRSAGLRKAAWPGEVLSLLGSLPRYLRAERHDRGEFIRVFLRRYAGMPAARLDRVVRGGYRDTLLRHTMPAAIDRINEHRAAGHRTILVTGSIGTLVQPIAHLFDEVVAGTMDVKDGVLTGYLAKPPLVDEARAAWLRQYAQTHDITLSQSYGYGDSHADLVWLELLGNPNAVNPDTNLSREAQRRRWRIHNWTRGSHDLTPGDPTD